MIIRTMVMAGLTVFAMRVLYFTFCLSPHILHRRFLLHHTVPNAIQFFRGTHQVALYVLYVV